MKRRLTQLAFLTLAAPAFAQINVGSDGSDGAFAFVADAGDPNVMTIDLGLAATATWPTPSPDAGQGVYDATEWAVVFKYTNVTVPTGKAVRFTNHASRAPVVWLSQGDVVIDGEVDLDGAVGHAMGEMPDWSVPGPGGFRGGRGWKAFSFVKGTAGFGPGGARIGTVPAGTPAGYAADGSYLNPVGQPPVGKSYGGARLTQLLGGSGGARGKLAFAEGPGSGAGGGALLLAADTRVVVRGSIHADGGTPGAVPFSEKFGGAGSGGAVRIVADEVELVTGALVHCLGAEGEWNNTTAIASPGRIRIEANVHTFETITEPVPSVGLPGPIFQPTHGTLTVASVAGLPVAGDPQAALIGFFADVTINDPGPKSVTIVGGGIPDQTLVELRVVDSLGDAIVLTSTLTATGQPNETSATIQVDFPASTVVLQARAVLP